MTQSLVDDIDALLPQTQCGRCDYPACRPYAQAVADGDAPINRCAPGGDKTIAALAALTSQPVQPQPATHQAISLAPKKVALIRESECIGCTLCIQACPVDAIVGSAKKMHTVISDACTGCDLCLPACPMICIDMVPLTPEEPTWTVGQPLDAQMRANKARQRYEARQKRLNHNEAAAAEVNSALLDTTTVQANLKAALTRAKEKRKPYES